jgi:hypothetical protein
MSHAPVVIRTFANELEAQLAQAVLDAHGIPSILLRDDAGGMHPMLQFLHGVRLAVRHVDAVPALRWLDAEAIADGGATDDGDGWSDGAPAA